jgi:hypothetical protein
MGRTESVGLRKIEEGIVGERGIAGYTTIAERESVTMGLGGGECVAIGLHG